MKKMCIRDSRGDDLLRIIRGVLRGCVRVGLRVICRIACGGLLGNAVGDEVLSLLDKERIVVDLSLIHI